MVHLGRWIKFISILFVFTFASSCTEEEEKPTTKSNNTKSSVVETPEFNADSAYAFVAKQVAFGPRTPNSNAARKNAKWMADFFRKLGWEVTIQHDFVTAYDGVELEMNNIIAKYNPSAKKRIQFSAHWDTRPWADQDNERTDEPIDGANDGASGVGVIMEMARVITSDSLETGIDVVLFDIEDYGKSGYENSYCYGSQYWYANYNPNQIKPEFGVNLDMVGDPNAQFTYEGFSMQYARRYLDIIWKAAKDLGHEKYFVNSMDGEIIDDHYWVNKVGIPCVDVIHRHPQTRGFAESWHTHDDNMDNISKKTLQVVGETMLQVIYRMK
jgi:hypothetical protein